MDKSGHQTRVNKRGALTPWPGQREGQIRTPKESERARDTHMLVSAEVQGSTMKQGIRESEGHSRSGEHKGRDKLGRQAEKKTRKQGPLTDWRTQRHGQVSIVKESERTTVTHKLESERGINEDNKRK
jgi:hypothetical protein